MSPTGQESDPGPCHRKQRQGQEAISMEHGCVGSENGPRINSQEVRRASHEKQAESETFTRHGCRQSTKNDDQKSVRFCDSCFAATLVQVKTDCLAGSQYTPTAHPALAAVCSAHTCQTQSPSLTRTEAYKLRPRSDVTQYMGPTPPSRFCRLLVWTHCSAPHSSRGMGLTTRHGPAITRSEL